MATDAEPTEADRRRVIAGFIAQRQRMAAKRVEVAVLDPRDRQRAKRAKPAPLTARPDG